MLPIFRFLDIPPIFPHKILGAFEYVFVVLGGFPVFAITHFIDDPVELCNHMEEIEDDLDMRSLALHSQDMGVPHIHHHRLQLSSLFGFHPREELLSSPSFSVSAHPNLRPVP